MVHLRLHDRLLGYTGTLADVSVSCYREVPRNTLAYDRVWVLFFVDILLLHSSSGGSC